MTREYQLSFCMQCVKRKFNSKKGIVYSLTDEHATFDTDCHECEVDEVAKKQLKRETQVKEVKKLEKDTLGLSNYGVKNRKVASYILIGGGIVWIALGFMLIDRIFFWPFFLLGFGIYLNIKKAKTEANDKRKDDSTRDNLEI